MKDCVHNDELKEPDDIQDLAVCLVTQSCPTLCDPTDCNTPGFSVLGDSPGKNTGVGCHALLQGIFPTQVSHIAGKFLYRLSHPRSPRKPEWVAWPLGDLHFPGFELGSPALQEDSRPAELPRKSLVVKTVIHTEPSCLVCWHLVAKLGNDHLITSTLL